MYSAQTSALHIGLLVDVHMRYALVHEAIRLEAAGNAAELALQPLPSHASLDPRMPVHMSKHMSKHTPKHMSAHVSKHISKHACKHMSKHMPGSTQPRCACPYSGTRTRSAATLHLAPS